MPDDGLYHYFSSLKVDSPAAIAAGKVVPSEWNRRHVVVAPAGAVLFNDGGEVGASDKLTFDPVGGMLTFKKPDVWSSIFMTVKNADGTTAMQFRVGYGGGDIGIGTNAGAATTPGGGSDGIFIGRDAGAAVYLGSGPVVIGSAVAPIAIQSNFGVHVGSYQSSAWVAGTRNVIVGGGTATAMAGSWILGDTAVGHANMGRRIGSNNGSNSTFGFGVFNSAVGGIFNSIYGANSANAILNGQYNSSAGCQCLGAVTNGFRNQGFGPFTGPTGDFNDTLCLGYGAAVNGSNRAAIGSVTAANMLSLGINMIGPSARLHLPAGAAAVGLAPFKLTPGIVLTVTEDGALEYSAAAGLQFTCGTIRNTLLGPTLLTAALADSLVNLAQTWNTTGNPAAIKLNVTNTASGVTSRLLDLQVGGVSKFWVDPNGDAKQRRTILTAATGMPVVDGALEYDGSGLWFTIGAVRTKLIPAITVAPGAFTFTATVATNNVNLAWTASTNVVTYQILRDAVVIATLQAGTQAYTDPVLNAGTYAYTMNAINPIGTTPSTSNPRSAVIVANAASFNAPLQLSLVPTTAGNPTFTFGRATIAYVTDFEGVLRQVGLNEARFHGPRRVENLITTENMMLWSRDASTVVTPFQSDPLAGRNAFKIENQAAGAGIFNQHNRFSTSRRRAAIWMKGQVGGEVIQFGTNNAPLYYVVLTTAWVRYTGIADNAGVYFILRAANAGTIWYAFQAQDEVVEGQSNQAPSEYVSRGVLNAPYHGNAVDGVKYFNVTHNNSIQSTANLCLQSQSFEHAAWVKVGMTVFVNTHTTPDLSLSADTLFASVIDATALQTITVPVDGQYVFSINLKRYMGTGPISITIDGVNYTDAGVLSTSAWNRISVTAALLAGTTKVGVKISNIDHYLIVGGAQFEPGSTPTTYVPTAFNVIQRMTEATGVAIPAAGFLGFVAENAATNICKQSQNFEHTSWVKPLVTVTPNTHIAPDGSLTADTVTATAGLATVMQTMTGTAAPYVESIWVKRLAGVGVLELLLDGVVTDVTALINAVTWTRVWTATKTLAAAPFDGGFRITVADDSFAVWGSQVEARAGTAQTGELTPTSYMPTTTANVARNADSLTWLQALNLDGAQGSTYAEVTPFMALDGVEAAHLWWTTGSMLPQFFASGGALSIKSAAGVRSTANVRSIGAVNKCASAWGAGACSVSLNGGAVGTGTFTPYTNTATIMVGALSNQGPNAAIKNVRFYSARISDAELVTMTT